MTRSRRDSRRAGARPGSQRGAPPPQEEVHPESFRWIVDGHNAIFAVREWEELQSSGYRKEARAGLEESLETFGRAAGIQIWVVYDGNHMERNPDAGTWTHLRTQYSLPPEEADDRIRFLVQRALHDGERPLVVTSDRRTLAGSLPAGVRTLSVHEFYHRVYARLLRRPEKWRPGGLEDIEQYFLSTSNDEEDRRRAGRPQKDAGRGGAAEGPGADPPEDPD